MTRYIKEGEANVQVVTVAIHPHQLLTGLAHMVGEKDKLILAFMHKYPEDGNKVLEQVLSSTYN